MKKKYPRIAKSKLILTQPATKAKIRVRLDSRTLVTIPHISALKLWKVKYPDAEVVNY